MNEYRLWQLLKANDQKDRICILTKYQPNYKRWRSEQLLGQIISV